MTRTKTILVAVVFATMFMTTSAVYAQSDWRTACDINNPLDNLECAIDHLENEINILIADLVSTNQRIDSVNATNISQQTEIGILQGNVTSNRSLIADRYIVESTENVPSFLNVQTVISCNAGDIAMAGGWDLPIDSLLTGARHFQDPNGFSSWEFRINNDDPVNDHPITFKVVCIDHTP